MIIPDINLLLYAHDDRAEFHEPARRWWEALINGTERVGVPWAVSTGFMRLITNRASFAHPTTVAQATGYVARWFGYAHVVPINPGSQHLALLGRLLEAVGVGGKLVPDAHLAAIAIEYQAELHSNDADFARFPGLRWRNPL